MFFKWITVLFFTSMTMVSHAQETSLGRIFSTPEQRAALDRARNALFDEQVIDELLNESVFPEIEEANYEQQSVVQFGGVVRQASGTHTVWLNGVPVLESELPANARLEVSDDVAVLHVRIADAEYQVKPGQTLDAEEGRVREAYEISPEQVRAINAEVALRADRMRTIAQRSAQRSAAISGDGTGGAAASTQTQIPSEQEALVQSVLEGMRLMQQLQEAQP